METQLIEQLEIIGNAINNTDLNDGNVYVHFSKEADITLDFMANALDRIADSLETICALQENK